MQYIVFSISFKLRNIIAGVRALRESLEAATDSLYELWPSNGFEVVIVVIWILLLYRLLLGSSIVLSNLFNKKYSFLVSQKTSVIETYALIKFMVCNTGNLYVKNFFFKNLLSGE